MLFNHIHLLALLTYGFFPFSNMLKLTIEGFGLVVHVYPNSDYCFRSTAYLGMIVFGTASFLFGVNEQISM